MVEILFLLLKEDIIFVGGFRFPCPWLRHRHIMVALLSGEPDLGLSLNDLAHPFGVLHDDEVVDCAHSTVEPLYIALVVEVHVHEQQASVHRVGGTQDELHLQVVERDQTWHPLSPEFLTEALDLPEGNPEDLMEAGPEGVDGEEVLVLGVLLFEVVADSHQLHVPLVEPEQLLLQLVRPDLVQLETLALEAAAGLELLVASHRVVQPLQLHLSHPRLQRLLHAYVQPNRCLLSDSHAADAVDYLHELEEGRAVFGLEIAPAVEQYSDNRTYLLPIELLYAPMALPDEEIFELAVGIGGHSAGEGLISTPLYHYLAPRFSYFLLNSSNPIVSVHECSCHQLLLSKTDLLLLAPKTLILVRVPNVPLRYVPLVVAELRHL